MNKSSSDSASESSSVLLRSACTLDADAWAQSRLDGHSQDSMSGLFLCRHATSGHSRFDALACASTCKASTFGQCQIRNLSASPTLVSEFAAEFRLHMAAIDRMLSRLPIPVVRFNLFEAAHLSSPDSAKDELSATIQSSLSDRVPTAAFALCLCQFESRDTRHTYRGLS